MWRHEGRYVHGLLGAGWWPSIKAWNVAGSVVVRIRGWRVNERPGSLSAILCGAEPLLPKAA